MKNLLLFLLLIPSMMFGQYNRDVYMCKYVGKPTVLAPSNNTISIDCTNNTVWLGSRTNNTWSDITSTPTGQGYLAKGQKGDKGDKGDAGVCPTCPPSGGTSGKFPFIVVFSNGTNDTPTIQKAVDSAYVTGQSVQLIGILKMASGVKIPKDIEFLDIGGGARLDAINNNAWTYFYSETPTSVTEAEGVYTNRRLYFHDLELRGWNSGAGQQQVGFDLMASENARYINLKGYNLKRFIDLTFALKTRVESCEANACIDGLVIRSGSGRYNGATLENASSNTCTVVDFRVYGTLWTNTGISVADASLVELNGIELEGGFMNIGIDYDCTASTSTGLNLSRVHFEAAIPCSIAVIRIKSSTMLHVIDQPNLIKPSILVEVIPINGGYPNVKFTNSSNQRVLFDDVNPILKTAVGVGWKFDNCDQPFVAYKMPKIFTGATMTNSCVRENGLSRWCIVNSPN